MVKKAETSWLLLVLAFSAQCLSTLVGGPDVFREHRAQTPFLHLIDRFRGSASRRRDHISQFSRMFVRFLRKQHEDQNHLLTVLSSAVTRHTLLNPCNYTRFT